MAIGLPSLIKKIKRDRDRPCIKKCLQIISLTIIYADSNTYTDTFYTDPVFFFLVSGRFPFYDAAI